MFEVDVFRVALDFILLFLAWVPVILFATVIEPFERGFYCDDTSIRYPYKDSSVPNWVLYFIGAILPIIAIVLIETFRVLRFDPGIYNLKALDPFHQFRKKPVHPLISNLYFYIGYFAFGAALCQGLTDLAKYTVGRQRPHFYEVCKPAVNCSTWGQYNFVADPKCTTTDIATLREARLSFPSGHSSFGAYTMFFLVLYIQSRLIWPMVSLLIKHILQNICVVLGVACALSRVSDYKHHWSDVLAGVVLGVIVACLTAFNMIGLFRHPNRFFSDLPPNMECSFGGDQFHSKAELQLFREYYLKKTKELNVALAEQGAPLVAQGLPADQLEKIAP